MNNTVYTAVTFAPVQGFIEKSRKLRDLYGSSFLLSYLAKAICQAASKTEGCTVKSPALIDVTRGTPNQIIVEGDFPKEKAQQALNEAWGHVVKTCQRWIEENLVQYDYHWQREWNAWGNHAWEFFWAQAEGLGAVRQQMNEVKRQRDWKGINWQGESSTLSGSGAIAWPGMTDQTHPTKSSPSQIAEKVENFYQSLSGKLSEAIISERERLNVPELVKRMITLPAIAKELQKKVKFPDIDLPEKFADISRQSKDPNDNRYTGWFQGDGDSIGKYLQASSSGKNEEEQGEILYKFSQAMMQWGEKFKDKLPTSKATGDADGMVVYAGGDDFLGVLYRNYPQPELKPEECLQWFYGFPQIWQEHKQPITVSVGFVWAAPNVPQRDVLQHCREAESSAKAHGRDRLAMRILFNSGNYLEWVCPWWFLEAVLTGCGRKKREKPWVHFCNDVTLLESRRGFTDNDASVALGLFEIYFGADLRQQLEQHLWDQQGYKGDPSKPVKTGILGNTQVPNHIPLLNAWIINLAKVGFHLYV
jgi:CRISPR-associated protein Cmr2